jgi:uncharacterized protein
LQRFFGSDCLPRVPPSRSVSRLAARVFVLRATGLVAPHASVGDALAHHGYVQIDPINICGRMHDHILRPRVLFYGEGDLMRHLHGPDQESPLPAEQRVAFEHHLPATGLLVALEPEAWPHLRAAMRTRTRRTGSWSGRLSPREKILAERIIDEIGARGPLSSDAIEDGRRARSVWGAATLVKSTMQKLFFHGRLLIACRARGRRAYDLPERVLPSGILQAPEPEGRETERWQVLLKLRQRRLVRLKRGELPWVEDLVAPLQVDGCPSLHCLRADLPLLDLGAPPVVEEPRLLAPLDPLIYDRDLTRRLWDFAYTWEVYTPPAKRVRGYYALPLLAGTELVGDADLRADRAAGRLRVVSRRVRRGHRASPAVQEVARFLGLKTSA